VIPSDGPDDQAGGGGVSDQTDIRAIGDRIERLLDQLAANGDAHAVEQAEELLRLVTELYGAGLARIVELVAADDPVLVRRLAADELVAGLLIVHGLHPDSLVARVQRALDSVRPYLGQHGGDVELLDVDGGAGAVHLRLLGSCHGCPSSAVTLRDAVERAIVDAAPEIGTIDVDEPAPEPVSTPVAMGRTSS
jgi:Fe-S cluster biogenesis protein NfuA